MILFLYSHLPEGIEYVRVTQKLPRLFWTRPMISRKADCPPFSPFDRVASYNFPTLLCLSDTETRSMDDFSWVFHGKLFLSADISRSSPFKLILVLYTIAIRTAYAAHRV